MYLLEQSLKQYSFLSGVKTLIKKGIYKIPGTIKITASGIILRGEGPGTKLIPAGKGQRSQSCYCNTHVSPPRVMHVHLSAKLRGACSQQGDKARQCNAYFGPIIFSGRTSFVNSASVR